MKKLLIVFLILAGIQAFAQPRIDYMIFRGKFTTAQRDLIEIPTDGAAWGWNVDTQQFEWADDSEVWQAFSAGGGGADGLGTARSVGPFTVVDADNATLNDNAVTQTKIADNAVVSSKILNGSVSPEKLSNIAQYQVLSRLVAGSANPVATNMSDLLNGVHPDLDTDDTDDVTLADAQTISGPKQFTAAGTQFRTIVPGLDNTYAIGQADSIWQYGYFDRVVHRAPDGEFWIWDTTAGNFLGLFKNASSTAGAVAEYTFRAGGPSSATDILHKAYGDANYATSGDLSGYLPLSGGTLTGILNLGGFNLTNLDVLSIGSGLDGDLLIPSNGSFTIGANGGVIPAMTVDGGSGTIDFPITPTVTADPYDATDWNDNDEVADKGSIRDEIETKVNNAIPGFTGQPLLGGMIQTQAQADADGPPPTGYLQVISDASPAKVVASATITMEGWKMYNDESTDAGTITLSDCDPGETLTVYINRASAPTLAGTGLTFNQLPNTTAFAAATQMAIYFEVSHDGTTVDYFYFNR